jgi:hypothetical protein
MEHTSPPQIEGSRIDGSPRVPLIMRAMHPRQRTAIHRYPDNMSRNMVGSNTLIRINSGLTMLLNTAAPGFPRRPYRTAPIQSRKEPTTP